MDGTLYDTARANFLAYRIAMQEAGYPLTEEMYQQCCVAGASYKTFAPQLGIHAEDRKRVHDRKTELYPTCFGEVRENRALFRLLEYARREVYLVVVTTAARANAIRLLKYFHRESFFDAVITQEDVQHTKPDPEGFLTAMSRYGVRACDTVIFEDSEIGLAAAKATGASVFAVKQF